MNERMPVMAHSYYEWPPKKARWLRTEAMENFRQSYRNYRQGHSKGAKGEVFTIPVTSRYHKTSQERLWFETEDNIHEISIFQDVEDPKVIQNLQQLEHYRTAYRCFRLGKPKGAEGELSTYTNHFSNDQLRLLPVAALARCLADQIRRETIVEAPIAKFHVHLGAGKLGLGLVLPTIVSSKCPFAIVQRPSDVWSPILKSTCLTIDVYINDEKLTTLYVIRSNEALKNCPLAKYLVKKEYSGVQEKYCCNEDDILGMLVLDPTLESLFLRSAEAISCSLGPGLKASLSRLPLYLMPHSGLYRPALYACENDHQAVEAIRKSIEELVYVRPCMVDRICSDRVIDGNKIAVTTEPYKGEIVVSAEYQESIKPAFGGPTVLLPSNSGAYSYLYNRKFLLVNGTHTTLAFMTLRQFCTDPSEAPGDFELLNKDTLNSEAQRELIAWVAARCLVLLHSHEVKVIKLVHRVNTDEEIAHHLWNYAMKTIERFSTVKDSTKRVLGGGVANRYETRLKAIVDTLQAFEFVPLHKHILKVAKFRSMDELRLVIVKLVHDTEQFVTLGLRKNSEKKPSQIIEEHHKLFQNHQIKI